MATPQKNYNTNSNNNFTNLQSEVNQVKDVMTDNIDKILKRGDALDDLADRTNQLESTAIQFNVQAKKIKRKMWWKNTKMMIILVGVILVILAVIATVIALKVSPSPKPTTVAPPPATTSIKSPSARMLQVLLQ